MQAEVSESPSLWMRLAFGRNPRRTLFRALFLAASAFVLFRYVILPIRVTGNSMEPTYLNGKVNFVNRLAFVRSKPRRGDVIGIHLPTERDLLLKRIVAMPKEHVRLVRGVVVINGERLEEPYLKTRGGFSMAEIQVEEDHYFVVGDNRRVSVYFQVPSWQIVGKVLY